MDSLQLETVTKYCCLSEDEFQWYMKKSTVDDLKKLYENRLNTDTKLSIDGNTLDVHKSILAARSPVFCKMFQQNMAESTKRVVVIEDVKMETMKEVVAFIYGKAKRHYDYETAMEIYYAADKYELKQLQEICGCILASQLDMENAHQILQLADRHHDKWLTKKVIKFITFHSVQDEGVAENLLKHDIK